MVYWARGNTLDHEEVGVMDQLDPGQAGQDGPGAAPVSADDAVKALSLPLYEAKGWMRLLGVLSIISGIFSIFTIWGILVCWIPIWVGIILMKAAGAVEIAHHSNDRTQFIACLCQLRTYFTLQGVLMLIGIIVGVIGFIIAGGAMLTMLSEIGEGW